MKRLYTTLLILLTCSTTTMFSQVNSITNLTVIPANPTITDTVRVVADVVFGYSGCEYQELNSSVSGFNIVASSHHCIGMLAAICNDQDTFVIDPLGTPGTYTFVVSLTSGAAPGPCTPGIGIDDMDTVSFIVSATTGLTDFAKGPIQLQVAPNPSRDVVAVSWNNSDQASLELIDMTGRQVYQGSFVQNTQLQLANFAPGVYFLKASAGHLERVTRLVIR